MSTTSGLAALLVGIGAAVLRCSGRRRTVRRRLDSNQRFRQQLRLGPARRRVVRLTEGLARRRHAPEPERLPGLLDDIARGCSAGLSLTAAFVANVTVPPTGDHLFSRTSHALKAGATIDGALALARPEDPDQTLTIHVLRLCALQGGNVSESLDRAAATLRERHAMRLERASHASQARLSAKVLTVLPIAFAAWTLLTTASVQQFVATPLGVTCVAMGVALNLTGWSLMNRVIKGGS